MNSSFFPQCCFKNVGGGVACLLRCCECGAPFCKSGKGRKVDFLGVFLFVLLVTVNPALEHVPNWPSNVEQLN